MSLFCMTLRILQALIYEDVAKVFMVVNQTLAESSLSWCQFKASVLCVILSFCHFADHMKTKTTRVSTDCAGTPVSGHNWAPVAKNHCNFLHALCIYYITYREEKLKFFSSSFLQQLFLLHLQKLQIKRKFSHKRSMRLTCNERQRLFTVFLFLFLHQHSLVIVVFSFLPLRKKTQEEKTRLDPSPAWGLFCESAGRRGPTCLWSCLRAVDRHWSTAHNHT